MSYSDVQQLQQQEQNSFYTTLNNNIHQTNTNFNVGVRMARENAAADNDTLGKCEKHTEKNYQTSSAKTAPTLKTKPKKSWLLSLLSSGQRSIIAIMAEVTMAQVKESSNFWGALFKCSQNQLMQQIKMAPEIAKFQIDQAENEAAGLRSQAKAAYKSGAWAIGSMAVAIGIGALGGGMAAKQTEDKAAEDAAAELGAGKITAGDEDAPTLENDSVGNGINNGQNPSRAMVKYSRLTSWFGRLQNYGMKMVSYAVMGGQFASRASESLTSMTVQAKALKEQAIYKTNAGKAQAAASEIQTLAQAAGTQSSQQFQLASQTEQNGITGFLQTLSQAANGLSQAIGGLLSVR